ncbi:MAG: twin-arginine translocase TatA/TatE family subunit [Acidimicrobiales bacterium]
MPSSLGAPEILVILVVALIVLGPSKLPEAARQIGKAMGEVRRWSQSVQSEIRDVIDVNPDSPVPPSPPVPSPPVPAPTEPEPPEPSPAISTPPAPERPELPNPTPPELPNPTLPELPNPTLPELPAPAVIAALPMSPGELPATTTSVDGPSASRPVAHAPGAAPEPPADESSSGGQPAG